MTPKKILVADDNAVVLKTTFMLLTTNGYEVATAVDGAGTIAAVRKKRPDLILLDISFPADTSGGGGVAWNGFLIIDWLRRLEESKNIPIIVISGSDPAKFKDRALAAGAACYFHKPINNDELLAAIRDTLGNPTGKTAPSSGSVPKPAA